MKWRPRRDAPEAPEPEEEAEARMAREAAEKTLRETKARWPEIVHLGELAQEIRSGRNGVSFIEDMAEALRPRPPRKRNP